VQGRRWAGAQLAFLGALALGVAIRAVDFLNCRSLGLDEARLAVNIASRSFIGLLHPLDMDQSAPPLFLWGERFVTRILGHGDCALRLLPVAAGTAAAILMYPFARRFLEDAEARLGAVIGIFCPLLITYSNAVKQYSVELLVAVLLLLLFEGALRQELDWTDAGGVIAAGVAAPWLSLSSVFVLSTAWLALVALAASGRKGAGRLAVGSSLAWGASGVLAYLSVYRAASRNPYMHRFWELAFVTPHRPGFFGHSWKTVEDLVWGFVAGDPLVDRRPFLWLLHLGSVLVVLLCLLGSLRIVRTRGWMACWWLWGPAILTVWASALGVFPIAPRLTLFLLPAMIVLFVAGLSEALARVGALGARRGLAVATAVIVLPMEFQAVARTFALEPSGHFQQLVRELRERRTPGEPVYVFVRSLPAWIYYSTNWDAPDTARVGFLTRAAAAGGPAFENAPSRGRVDEEAAKALTYAGASGVELIGLPSGMEWREVEEHVRLQPDSGWVEVEARRIEQAAAPGIWVLASTYYAAERRLFERLEQDASRRTFAHLRNGSALVRYEFPDSLGRERTSATAGR
jgi:dolichyl-phosphate-mannose-protein mannosyltransferase